MNILNGNTFYVDTEFSSETDDLTKAQTLVTFVLVTATDTNGIISLGDVGNNSTTKKLEFRVATSGESKLFRFSEVPILFPKGIRILELTNAVATIVIKSPGN